MADDAATRTEPASRARRERALAAGVFAPSRTLLAAAAVLGALSSLRVTWPATAVALEDLMRGAATGRFGFLPAWGPRFAHVLFEALAATLGGAAVATLAVGLVATRGRLRAPAPEWGNGRRAALPSLAAALVALLAAALLGGVILASETRRLGAFVAHAPGLPFPQLMAGIRDTLGSLVSWLMAALALVVAVEIFRHERRRHDALFVTPREARQQAREDEGSPLLRSARQARQREAPGATPTRPGLDA